MILLLSRVANEHLLKINGSFANRTILVRNELEIFNNLNTSTEIQSFSIEKK